MTIPADADKNAQAGRGLRKVLTRHVVTVELADLLNRDLSLAARGLWAFLCSFGDEDVLPGEPSLAGQLGVPQDDVEAAMDELRAIGYVTEADQ